jgi:hypothetical protein
MRVILLMELVLLVAVLVEWLALSSEGDCQMMQRVCLRSAHQLKISRIMTS